MIYSQATVTSDRMRQVPLETSEKLLRVSRGGGVASNQHRRSQPWLHGRVTPGWVPYPGQRSESSGGGPLMSVPVLKHPQKIPLCSRDKEPLGQDCPWLLPSGAGTALGNDIPRRQNPRRPRPPWESVWHVSPRPPEWLRDVESTGRQVPLQELSNEPAAEDPWLPVPGDPQSPHYLISYTREQSRYQDRSGAEAPAGLSKAGSGTHLVEPSPHSFPWATSVS